MTFENVKSQLVMNLKIIITKKELSCTANAQNVQTTPIEVKESKMKKNTFFKFSISYFCEF